MKNILFTLSIVISSSVFSQAVIPFVDFNRWFRSYDNGTFKFIEMQEIKGYKAGDNLVAYIDIRGNLRVYDGKERYDLSNMNLEFQVSDYMIGWNIGTTLQVWRDGKTKTLSYFGGQYIVKDDIVVFTDTRSNSIVAYWNGQQYPMQTSTSDIFLKNSVKIGENILAYADNGGLFKIFYKGQFYEVGVWNGDIDLKSGTDIVAFNDPNTRTFAVFDKGNFLDVEDQWMKKYKAGRGFVVYENAGGSLMVYRNGQTSQLSSYPGNWDVVDDIIVYENGGYTYCDVNGTSIEAANYRLTDFKIKNATLAFRNAIGGVSAVVDGKVVELTNMPGADFEIFGNSVLVKLAGNNYIVYQKGKLVRA
ncbi:MAG: hypothetical protein M9916_11840 [Crocinitomicaceae bacterium]|nr:hypothetical protein [Crocinitomicaceae bacterium]